MKTILRNFGMLALVCSSCILNAQVSELVVVQIENEGKVPGKTYHLFAKMSNENDQLLVVYGDSINPLSIESNKPFYQHPMGGGLAKNSSRLNLKSQPALPYDSWITIGGVDNYDCMINVLNLDLASFESAGGFIQIPKDGAWFTLPTDAASKAGSDKMVLLGQFTTAGNLVGQMNIMSKKADGESQQQLGLKFSSRKP
jgi:hypothetical protein